MTHQIGTGQVEIISSKHLSEVVDAQILSTGLSEGECIFFGLPTGSVGTCRITNRYTRKFSRAKLARAGL